MSAVGSAGFRTGPAYRLAITARADGHALSFLPHGEEIPDAEAFAARLAGFAALDRAELTLAGGDPLLHPELDRFIQMARAAGAAGVAVETRGLRLALPGRARQLAEAGLGRVTIWMLSPSWEVCERLIGRRRALEAVLQGIRLALDEGLEVDLRVPVLGQGVTAIHRTLSMALRAAAGRPLRAMHVALPAGLPAYPLDEHTPPLRYDALVPDLAAAAALAEANGVDLPILDRAGLPFCVLASAPELLARCRFDPGRPLSPAPGFVKPSTCEACHYAPRCRGTTQAYAAAFGAGDLRPLTGPLEGLEGDARGSARREWSEEERRHARASDLKIMRLTLACNQACVFCSTDESSETILRTQPERLRQIRRWADAGVTWISFSGGEPTLVEGLPELIRVATRLGVRNRELVTNGVRLAKPARLDALVEAGLNRLFVSLHAADDALSDRLTGRSGDFARTVAAAEGALARGVQTTLNHVICSENHAALPDFVRFVAARLAGARVTFAFISPLYMARRRPELMPRISEVQPSLVQALDEARRLGVDALVLCRPGIPPCFLGPRRLNHSDLPKHVHRIRSEDAYKKEKSPRCVRCMYDGICAGLWKDYTALHGTDELVPIELTPARRG
jgi:molybdenum cofactor biosynthesis enzyme MoaA